MCCSCGKPLPSRHHLTWNCPDRPVPEDLPRAITKPALVSRMPQVRVAYNHLINQLRMLPEHAVIACDGSMLSQSGQARTAWAGASAHAGLWYHLYLVWTNRSIRLKRLSFVGCTRFDQCYPSISSLGLSFPVLLYTLACQSRCCSAMFCTWLVERSVFSLSSFHVTFPSLPWFQNLSWSPPGQKFRPFMASVEVSG